ncbi:hypothetical protein BD414DRAFT_518025 [Trametes punicea]|nr:hypothetical protein BD414DRAFT_518025 [Trametes punicea]
MFGLLSRSTSKTGQQSAEPKAQEKQLSNGNSVSPQEHATTDSVAEAEPAIDAPSAAPQQPSVVNTSSTTAPAQVPTSRPQKRTSWPWRSLVHPKGIQDPKPSLPSSREEAAQEATARQEYIERRMVRTRSERRAHESALLVRELIIGPSAMPTVALPKGAKVSATSPTSLQKMQKVKARLIQPQAAQKVIAQLRQLPTSETPIVVGKTSTGEPVTTLTRGPIHAVCLPYTDAEAHELHFSKLEKLQPAAPPSSPPSASPKTKEQKLDILAVSSAAGEIASVTATSLEKLKEVLGGLNVVSLITTPDLGFGQPGDGPGLLRGAVPSATAIVQGIEEMTPQLMALGYATGKAILPSHAGVYPPTDRMSVITYWWGLEVVMPEPSVKYLSNVPSIAHTVINCLTALAIANGGVAEIMPFVRYISQYIDAEWNLIRQADKGKGVVCAATWIMPAALVPRAWDFPQPPVAPTPAAGQGDGSKGTSEAKDPAAQAQAPSTSTSAPPVSSASTGPNPTLMTPPIPEHNETPVFVAPAGDPSAQTSSVRGDPSASVPGVTVTPPTPPASETLDKAVGEAVRSTAAATEASAGAAGEAPPQVAAAT